MRTRKSSRKVFYKKINIMLSNCYLENMIMMDIKLIGLIIAGLNDENSFIPFGAAFLQEKIILQFRPTVFLIHQIPRRIFLFPSVTVLSCKDIL